MIRQSRFFWEKGNRDGIVAFVTCQPEQEIKG